jgi:hypothetical protein
LFINPGVRRYGLRQQEAFLDYLETPENNCVLRTIDRPEDLMLDATGRTETGYQYTWTGFKALTTLLCDGLQTSLLDLVGYRRTRGHGPAGLCDFTTTVSFFNAVLRLRFSRLQTSQMVCSPGAKTIDGIVSTAYQFLSNRRYVAMLDEKFKNHTVKFLAAAVSGRKLAVWYRDESHGFTVTCRGQSQPWFLGFFGNNSEGTHASVRFAPAVFSGFGVGIGSYETHGRRQVHTGADLEGRLAEMFTQVIANAPTAETYAAQTAAAGSTLLRVAGNEHVRARRIETLVRRLRRPGVPRAIAREAVMLGLQEGSDREPDLRVQQEGGSRFPERTVYDLACGAMRCGLRLGARREAVEQLAYAILTGSLNLQEE